MLGEHPSSLTELHAQKHQVNSQCSIMWLLCHLNISCMFYFCLNLNQSFQVWRQTIVWFFYSWMRLCKYPLMCHTVKSWTCRCKQWLLTVRGAEGDNLLWSGYSDIPEWVPSSLSHRALPWATAAQHRLLTAEGTVFPPGMYRHKQLSDSVCEVLSFMLASDCKIPRLHMPLKEICGEFLSGFKVRVVIWLNIWSCDWL